MCIRIYIYIYIYIYNDKGGLRGGHGDAERPEFRFALNP